MDPLKVPPAPETKLHFLDYWRIIRIRKTVIIAVFLLVVITATLVTFILPELFSSFARIKVERDQSDITEFQAGRPMMGSYDPYFIQTEFEVIQSELMNQYFGGMGLPGNPDRFGDHLRREQTPYERAEQAHSHRHAVASIVTVFAGITALILLILVIWVIGDFVVSQLQ